MRLLSCCHICVMVIFCAFGELGSAALSAETPKFKIFATEQVAQCGLAQAFPASAKCVVFHTHLARLTPAES